MEPAGCGSKYTAVRSLASAGKPESILDESAEQAVPDKVNGLISRMTTETLNLRPNVLVNVTPAPGK